LRSLGAAVASAAPRTMVGREGFEPSKAEAGRFTVCSLWPLGYRPHSGTAYRSVNFSRVPSFDIVSEIDRQELRNAIDQAQRELATRFDFKNTNSEIDQKELVLTLSTVSEDRLRALRTLLEEKLVKRKLSLKGLDWGKIEQASGDTVRQVVTVKVGIDSDKAREINRLIKEKGPKGVSSQSQGQQIRVTGKKRDDLQTVMSLLRESDLGIPLQFENFRD
jgi:uncharacterized protein YajQ (UPF0234 family)